MVPFGHARPRAGKDQPRTGDGVVLAQPEVDGEVTRRPGREDGRGVGAELVEQVAERRPLVGVEPGRTHRPSVGVGHPAGSGRSGADEGVRERADALDLDLDPLPGGDRADPGRRAGEDDVARSRVKALDAYETSAATPCTMSAVVPSCTTSPSRRVSTESDDTSRSVSIHGPSGQKVSKPLARDHCPSERCRSRAVTSLAQVYPKTAARASSARSLLIRPMTTASSPS